MKWQQSTSKGMGTLHFKVKENILKLVEIYASNSDKPKFQLNHWVHPLMPDLDHQHFL